ncbi:MAG: hypothetical protein HZA79_16975 [Sphingobacteriales bacterium]|nr:hypothetical protein [Sphingobacteriales bacterium]
MHLFEIGRKSKKTGFKLLWILLLSPVLSFSQLAIVGPTSVTQNTSATYYPTYGGSSTYYLSGTYTWTISGGVVKRTTDTTKTGTSRGNIGDNLIDVAWTGTSGTLTFTCALGTTTINVSIVAPLNGGTASPSSQAINYATTPSAISCTVATGGAANPSYAYQWQYSADNVQWYDISGATGQNYSPAALYSSQFFRRKVTETTSSSVAYSSVAFITVYPQLTCSISPASQSVSNGSVATALTSSVGGGTGSYTYQWQVSPNNSTWSNIATTANYSPGTVTATNYYRLIVTSNGASVTSGPAIVIASFAPSASLAITTTTASGNGSINTLSCTAGGGTGSYTYAWYYSTNGGASFQPIAGATGSSYTTGVVTATSIYYVVVTSGGYSSNSNSVVVNMPDPPVISTSSTILCGGSSATLTATGGSGSYRWYNAANTQVGTGTTYITNTAGTYYAVSVNSFGVSAASNSIGIAASGTPYAAPITGATTCALGSSIQLSSATPGGTWSSSNTLVARVGSTGVVTGDSAATATITYTITSGCGTASQTLGITVTAASSVYAGLGRGIADPVITDTISLVQGLTKSSSYQQDTYSLAHDIRNVLALRVIEETAKYIPGDFTATVAVKLEYGHSVTDIYTIDSVVLRVNYKKDGGTKYDALNYFHFRNAEFTRATVVRVDAPTIINGVGFDTKQVLLLTNTIAANRYYQLADNKKPVLSYTNPTAGAQIDSLLVSWTIPDHSLHNGVQLEWTWLEDELAGEYMNGASLDTAALFAANSTRIDLPSGAPAGSYDIPLLYGGTGRLYMRLRAVNTMPSGSRSDGLWSGVKYFSYGGHSDSLNWQASTTYAEEGKRKTVIKYADGTLRTRQTVTKDNSTHKTVVAETLYDGEGRPAIEILPAPGINNIIAYTRNLNKFNTQPDNRNYADYFDFTTAGLGKYGTKTLNPAVAGAARYYSSQNPDAASGMNKNIPEANGYAFAATRYTPDATGRILRQGGVGDSLQIGGSHATRYFYGTPSQEELDGLFGTEVGLYSHYFKNMVQDANGQMSVSYVDMHGRTIATALAGDSPANLQALNLTASGGYSNQSARLMTRNLLNRGTNILKGNSIESINSILVPSRTNYQFNYQLTKQTLQLPKCGGGTVSYDCKFNLQISVADESGDTTPVVYNYTGIDNINFQQSLQLAPGSYSVRKSLVINQDSLDKFMQLYATEGVGICTTRQFLIDSIAALDSTISGCGITPQTPTMSSCLTSLGTYTSYLSNYATRMGLPSVNQLTSDQINDIRNQYVMDSTFCTTLNDSISHTLEITRMQMLADMVPYSGQYALDSVGGTMYNKFNIFSNSGQGLYPQPYFQKPTYSLPVTAGRYYDAFGNVDSTVLPLRLSTMTRDEFESEFKDSWANSLLPYHPEYPKLKFAEDSMRRVYNFIDSADVIPVAINLVNADPFFSAAYATTADKNLIKKYSDTTWVGGKSMWQLSYGDAFGCPLYTDTVHQINCYNNMPKQLATIGSSVNNGTAAVTLTATIQARAWDMYRSMYRTVRTDMVNKYISTRPNITDTTYNQELIAQRFLLHFPFSNSQQAQNLGWGWYPGSNGVLPVYHFTDSVRAYSGKCESYINAWKLSLANCTALDNVQGKTRAQILDTLVRRMREVCEKGTDASNPYGSSTVSPAYSMGTYTSFEQVVNGYLDSLSIPRSLYCNPYSIEFPKPYGHGPIYATTVVSGLDTCACNQYNQIKTAMISGGVNINSQAAVNAYLWSNYQDSLSTALFQGLGRCGSIYLYNCRDVDTTCYEDTISYRSYPCIRRICDTLRVIPLSSPQRLPDFLKCGYVNAGCFNCGAFKSLDSAFYTLFGKHPVFTGTNLADSVIAWNQLFAKYVNFKTGLQHNWMYYAGRFNADSCAVGGLTGTKNTLSICLDKTTLSDTTGFILHLSPCQRVRNQATIKAGLIYEYLRVKALADFKAAYYASCVAATESFVAIDTVKEQHYTLYYYDMAGNLIKTVPPRGVNPVFRQSWIDSVEAAKAAGTLLVPQHQLVTRYNYNSLNQVTLQRSPDGGVSRFYYDRLGRLAISQNGKQAAQGNIYSYTRYDKFGRIAEVGQITGGAAMTDAISKDTTSLQGWLSSATNTRNQITSTGYDLPYGYDEQNTPNGTLWGQYLTQRNLRNRVSYSIVVSQASNPLPSAATYYTYDIHGNVDTLLQDFGATGVVTNAMNQSGNRYKKTVYNYDLVSGKVNQVNYQPGETDAYYHRYSYDAENRLTDVFTGRDSVMLFLFPEREAHYTYYRHGPLARTDLGQLRVQGSDYVYSLQGWIKGVNPAMGGTLVNGTDTTEAFPAAQDVYGYSLHYYKGDYKAIGFTPQLTTVLGALGANAAPLYNGNIAAMAVNIPKLGAAKLYNYHYDQLNRIVSMDLFNGLNPAAGTFTPAGVSDYRERVSYDPNGNIMTYNRHGDAARLSMDSMSYYYTANTNRLHKVTDAAADAAPGVYSNYNDLKQGQADNNYQYDEIGNLTADASEGVTNISWTVYGKIASVTKNGSTITYSYDASGNRIIKKTATEETYYVRDASGNVLSVYTKPVAGSLQQAELHLYGSSRLGMVTARSATDSLYVLSGGFVSGKSIKFTRGEKLFELSNHLGNVLVTVTDRRQQVSAGGINIDNYLADVVNASDYYPGGMEMPGRKYSMAKYRYGFNGKENDNEIKGEGNQQDYGFRIYDTRLVRFLSVDPLTPKYPELTPYQFASNSPIAGSDLDGLELLPRFKQSSPFSLTTHALTKTIEKTTAYQILRGTMEGAAGSFHKQWNFWTRDIAKKETWVNMGQFVEEFIIGSAPGVKTETPIIDAKFKDFEDNVVKGNAYTRAKYFSELGTDALTAYIGDKGIGEIASLKVLTNIGKEFRSTSIRFTQNTVNEFGKALKSVASGKYDPIDIVKMGDGMYSTIDNTRLLAAQQLGLDIKATVHSFEDALPKTMLERFENPAKKGEFAKTWGEAIQFRTGRQTGSFAEKHGSNGTFVQPEVKSY